MVERSPGDSLAGQPVVDRTIVCVLIFLRSSARPALIFDPSCIIIRGYAYCCICSTSNQTTDPGYHNNIQGIIKCHRIQLLPFTKASPGTVGDEISIGGVIIRSGDLMVADRDGAAVLPQEKIPEALEGMPAVRARERNIEERIAAGMTMPDWVKEFLAGDRVKYIP